MFYNEGQERVKKGEIQMNRAAVEKKLCDLGAEYVYEQAVGSLLLLLMSVMEDQEKGEQSLPYAIHADILENKQKIRQYILQLRDILEDTDESRREAAMQECMAQKQKLMQMYECIRCYMEQKQVLTVLAEDEMALRKYREENINTHDLDWSLFFADCHSFLESAESPMQQREYMGDLLRALPMRMARQKYYDLIAQNLKTAFQGESKAEIEKGLQMFYGICCPKAIATYGKYFPEVAQWLGEKQMVLPHKMSDETLASYLEELSFMEDSIAEIREYFSCILHDWNSLILLFFLTFGFADLTERDSNYADLYETVCEYLDHTLSDVEQEAYQEELFERLEQAIEPNIDRANAIRKEQHSYMKQIKDPMTLEEDTKKILVTQSLIEEYFFGDLEDEWQKQDDSQEEPATQQEINQTVETFIEQMRAHLETLPTQNRKLIMQLILGVIPPAYSVEEFMDMVQEAIDLTVGEEQKALIVNKIGTVFDNSDYTPIVSDPHHHHDGCDCGHEHHHHHDGCDCGHEHHHHHDGCDCGHEHHHHDGCDCGHEHKH